MNEKRRAPRRSCRFPAQVRFDNKSYNGQIVDLSASGMRLVVDRLANPSVGWRVEIVSEELGAITGIVQWRRTGSFGVKLELSSNTRAKVEAVWKNFMAAGQATQPASVPRAGSNAPVPRAGATTPAPRAGATAVRPQR